MLIEDISVVFLYVHDLAKSVAFYRDVLGLSFGAQQGDWIDCEFPSGVRFAFHEAYEGREPQTPGTAVVSFAVRDLDAVADRLRNAGVSMGEVLREEFGSFLEFFDPDGYRIQLFASHVR